MAGGGAMENQALSRGVSQTSGSYMYFSIYLRSLLTGWSFCDREKHSDIKIKRYCPLNAAFQRREICWIFQRKRSLLVFPPLVGSTCPYSFIKPKLNPHESFNDAQLILHRCAARRYHRKIHFCSHYVSPLITLCVRFCVCVCVCVVIKLWDECALCVFMCWFPISCGLTMVTMRTAWRVTSLQQCDIIARRWLILLARCRACVRACARVWECLDVRRRRRRRRAGEKDNKQPLWTSMCFILCNKNNYIVFVLGA